VSTKIEWVVNEDGTAGETWNPTLGCKKVSPGCDACYAIRTATIRAGNPHPAIADAYAGLTERTDNGLDWTGVVRTLPDRLDKPLRWRKPRRIFVDSQSDLFHDAVPDEFIAQVFAVMAATPRHTYQLLTKRHGRMRSLLNVGRFFEQVVYESETYDLARVPWPLPNLWLGVSVEDQKRADLRVPALLHTPAAVRWISAEPLLGPVDLSPYLAELDWVVAGGESGPGARLAVPHWFRQMRDQCAAADVPFLFKQWGDWGPTGAVGIGGTDPRHVFVGPPIGEYGHGEEMARVGKKAAGRLLDGELHDAMPERAR
jgi:protein gp37